MPTPRTTSRRSVTSAIVATLMLVTAATIVEQSDILPLEGQAMPTYGTVPVHTTSRRSTTSSSRRSSQTEARRASRSATHGAAPAQGTSASTTTSSASVSSTSTSSSVASSDTSSTSVAASHQNSSSLWTGDECTSGSRHEACQRKVKAIVAGDYSCLRDSLCQSAARLTCTFDEATCRNLILAKWIGLDLLPTCSEKDVTDCATAYTWLAKPTTPRVVQTCLDSALCRSLLANFHRGDFSCRQHEPCLDALESLVADPTCDSLPWCATMKAIDTRYDERAKECVKLSSSECAKLIGIDTIAAKQPSSFICRYDSQCRDDLTSMTEALAGETMAGMFPLTPACFLWDECRSEFEKNKNWFCRTPGREAGCKERTDVWEYLTKTQPACVTSGNSRTCQQTLRQLLNLRSWE